MIEGFIILYEKTSAVRLLSLGNQNKMLNGKVGCKMCLNRRENTFGKNDFIKAPKSGFSGGPAGR